MQENDPPLVREVKVGKKDTVLYTLTDAGRDQAEQILREFSAECIEFLRSATLRERQRAKRFKASVGNMYAKK